ncbi:polysaccharide biosynthesis protein GumE [Pseudoxanthomonas wuyuanensis]|uniref:Putative polymerase n=1 Tax=Pseudoxanthomonas wuyuanensis TaxID=1073196 RepID=A0A286D7A5_9GAMM|nr:polysaccharide biosynthesis protein GumE [Pseudoxanthomonas wuyuanensis]KAF1721065.1 polysaccharide biosynthesis protein GumE [Pseudoxanthomonas wuyuanensis]SOD54504.1 putative polymerase [Pseudoxanthomonas wuyuanensis]
MTNAGRCHKLLIELVLLVGVGYNFLLAVLNAQVFAVGPGMAYLAELLIYTACFGLGIWSLDRQKTAIVLTGIGLIVLVSLARFIVTWQIDPKFARDAIIPFAFLVLGAAYRGSLPALVLRLAAVVAIVAVFEIAAPQSYGDVVNPKSYFVNTRGATEEGFWNEDSNLYISATRPGERNWLPGTDLARASSIFVEPITMGNFIIFFCAAVLAFWQGFSWKRLAFSFLLIVFLLGASDSRLASGTCLMMLLLAPLLRRIDQRLSFVIFFVVLLAGWLLVEAMRVDHYEDTMIGRIFFTVDSMRNLSPAEWFGLEPGSAYRYFDSGIAYFIASQSIVVVLAFLLAYSFLLMLRSSDGQAFKNLFMFAFSLSLLVSNGYFSVKTAALWWFVCGYLWQQPAFRAALDATVVAAGDRRRLPLGPSRPGTA